MMHLCYTWAACKFKGTLQCCATGGSDCEAMQAARVCSPRAGRARRRMVRACAVWRSAPDTQTPKHPERCPGAVHEPSAGANVSTRRPDSDLISTLIHRHGPMRALRAPNIRGNIFPFGAPARTRHSSLLRSSNLALPNAPPRTSGTLPVRPRAFGPIKPRTGLRMHKARRAETAPPPTRLSLGSQTSDGVD